MEGHQRLAVKPARNYKATKIAQNASEEPPRSAKSAKTASSSPRTNFAAKPAKPASSGSVSSTIFA